MGPPSEELIRSTIRFWQTRTDRALSHEDARVSIENIAGFFDVLKRWAAINHCRQDDSGAETKVA